MVHAPRIGGNDSRYAWHDMPADRRDRDIVLRLAEARGIRPAWTDRHLSPWARTQTRLIRAERACEALAARLLAQEAA